MEGRPRYLPKALVISYPTKSLSSAEVILECLYLAWLQKQNQRN